jgi:hypothetical protein
VLLLRALLRGGLGILALRLEGCVVVVVLGLRLDLALARGLGRSAVGETLSLLRGRSRGCDLVSLEEALVAFGTEKGGSVGW